MSRNVFYRINRICGGGEKWAGFLVLLQRYIAQMYSVQGGGGRHVYAE